MDVAVDPICSNAESSTAAEDTSARAGACTTFCSPYAAANKDPGSGDTCQVFLSHAGEQKRDFVDFLVTRFNTHHPGVEVFLDDYSLQKGGEAMEGICAALRDACVVVLILSTDFVRKQYPMEELELVLEWREQGSKATLLPVFLNLTWAQLNATAKAYKTGDVALLKPHQPCAASMECSLEWDDEAKDKVQRQHWGCILAKLCRITGTRCDQVANSRATKLVEVIVLDTLKALEAKSKLRTNKLQGLPLIQVGLETERDKLVQRLSSDARHMLLLHGMGGIGKTTLAKAVFNKLHDADHTVPCCFLSLNPAMPPGTPSSRSTQEDLEAAQRMLLAELAHREKSLPLRSKQGLIAEHLRGKKVLLVVDNVWDDQLSRLLTSGKNNSFMSELGSGSVVLVTSCDRRAVDDFGDAMTYELQFLTTADSLDLLCQHAYNRPPNSQDGTRLKELAAHCGGLPKALEVVGKRLSNTADKAKFLRNWKAAVQVCYEDGNESLFRALGSSWDALGVDVPPRGAEWQLAEGQESLLDIVRFLKDRCWEVVECYCQYGHLEKLEELALVRRSRDGTLDERTERVTVHNAVADFCKMSQQAKTNLDLRLELSPALEEVASDCLECVMDGDRCGNPVGLWLHGWKLDGKGFAALSKHRDLRMLQLDCSMAAEQLSLPLSLRCLGVEGVGSSPHLCLQLDGTRQHNTPKVVLEQLQHQLSIEFLQGRRAPLHTLWLRECPRLQSVDLGCLPGLKELKISGCKELLELRGLSRLSSLGVLELRSCRLQLETKSEGAGAHLWKLLSWGAGLPAAQDDLDVSHLAALEHLHLEDCKPRSIAGLASLQHLAQLKLYMCLVLEALPGLEALHSLTSLEVQRCQELRHLQLSASLVELRVGHCYSLATISTLTGSSPGPAGPAGLAHLEVVSCPRLNPLPCLRSLLPDLRSFHFSLRNGREVQWHQGDRPGCCPWRAPAREYQP